jgi:hypothetical protein
MRHELRKLWTDWHRAARPGTENHLKERLLIRGFGIRVPSGSLAMTWGVYYSRSFSSLAEHLYFGAGVVDVDGDLVELVDEFLDVLRLELSEVDRYS